MLSPALRQADQPGGQGRAADHHQAAAQHPGRQRLAQQHRTVEHREHRHYEGYCQRLAGADVADQAEEQDVGQAGAHHAQHQQGQHGVGAGPLGRPEPQRGQGQAQRGADLAAGGGDQGRYAGEKALGVAAADAVADGGQQAGQHGPAGGDAMGVGLEAGFVPSQQGHAYKTNHQAQAARAVWPVL